MAYYAFINPILPGKVQEWKNLIGEMNGHRSTERNESRKDHHIERLSLPDKAVRGTVE